MCNTQADARRVKVRLRFEKTGPARHISHLDLMRTFQRVFRRAELPLAYSEGFNPHPYLSAARPLPVGVSSVCELLDLGLTQPMDWDQLPARISRVLPAGLQVLEAWPARRKFQEIAWAVYRIELAWDKPRPKQTLEMLTGLFYGRSLPVVKKSKKGMVEIDAAPLTRDVSIISLDERRVVLQAGLAAGETSLGPGQLPEALLSAAGEGFAPWVRTETLRLALLDEVGEEFR